MSDDHFHDLVHDVRSATPKDAVFGTALVLGSGDGHKAVWGEQINFEVFSDNTRDDQTRELEIFLDVLGAFATTTTSFILDDRFETEISDKERRAKKLLVEFLRSHSEDLKGTRVGAELSQLSQRLGG